MYEGGCIGFASVPRNRLWIIQQIIIPYSCQGFYFWLVHGETRRVENIVIAKGKAWSCERAGEKAGVVFLCVRVGVCVCVGVPVCVSGSVRIHLRMNMYISVSGRGWCCGEEVTAPMTAPRSNHRGNKFESYRLRQLGLPP